MNHPSSRSRHRSPLLLAIDAGAFADYGTAVFAEAEMLGNPNPGS